MRVPQVSERIKEAPAQALRGVFAGIGQLLLITDKLRNKAPYQDVRQARPLQAERTNGTTAASPARRSETTVPDVTAEAATAEAATAEAVTARPVTAEAPVTEGVATEAPPATAAPARRTKPAAAKPTAAKPVAAKPATAKHAAAKAAPVEPAAERVKPPKRQSARDFDKTGNVRLLAEPAAVTGPAAAGAAGAAGAGGAPLANYDGLSVASLRARLRNLDIAQVRGLADYERAHAARDDVLAMYERRIAKLEAG